MAIALQQNAECKGCKRTWYENALITYRCPFCKSKNIKIEKLIWPILLRSDNLKPTRVKKVNGKHIEEFYWGGTFVVYVDNRLFEGDFEQVINNIVDEQIQGGLTYET